MKKLWECLNTPLVVALISIMIVFVLLHSGLFFLRSIFDQDEKRRNEVDALGRLQLVSFSEANAPTNAPQKYIGTIRNNSSFIVYDVQAAICAYDEGGKLTDVISRKLQGVGKLPAGQNREFFVERTNDWSDRGGPPPKIEAAKTTISFVATETTKTKD